MKSVDGAAATSNWTISAIIFQSFHIYYVSVKKANHYPASKDLRQI